ncbi:O-antigen ligase [Bradyrhizobium sp. CB82]|uniref:O-antigen polymerase n=1 Tax=Bradyrhizobium sp. CB82 TaxID=3039159 RepID=UPI0024B1864D|nr:O-antigen polymerase [Bradyrhizobium sp. CB82]WFU39434.1 O-antigen ligase [Bradyrhizobium sp. CB82]
MIEIALVAHIVFFVALVAGLSARGFLNIYSGLMLYLAFHFMVFVQRPLVVYLFDIRSEFEFMRYMPTDEVFLRTLFVTDLGLLSFILAYLASLGFKPIQPTFNYIRVTQSEARSFLIAFAPLLPLILYSFLLALTMRQTYGVGVLLELGQINMTVDPATGQKLFADTTAYVVNARNFAFPFAALLIHVTRARWWSYLAISFCALIALQLGERWEIVISGLVASMMTLYIYKRRAFTWVHYSGMAVVLALFVMIGQNRDSLIKFLTTGEVEFDFDIAKSSFGAHPDFANFDFLTYVIAKVPAVSGTYSYFTQYLGMFTQPIPRILWPDKPVGSPVVWVNLDAYGHFTSRTTSLVGDGWISFGYPGVVITLSLCGWFFGAMFRRFCQPRISIYFYCAYFWMVGLLLQWARDGGYKILDFFLFCIGPLLLAYGIERTFWGRRVPIADKAGA